MFTVSEHNVGSDEKAPVGIVWCWLCKICAEGDVLLAKITPCFENGKLGIAAGLRNGKSLSFLHSVRQLLLTSDCVSFVMIFDPT
jgi:hypothetical protein